MSTRLNPYRGHYRLLQPLIDFGNAAETGLPRSVVDFVKIRASQINGCSMCLHMHTRDARKGGETEERIYMLDAWRESPLYTDAERAAIAWTEALTRDVDASGEVYDAVNANFTEEQQVQLTLLVAAVNGFNRINRGFRVPHPVTVTTKEAA